MISFIKQLLHFITGLFKKKEDTEMLWGLLGIGEKSTDYVFWSSLSAIEELEKRGRLNRQVKYEYNQWAQYKTRNWCTIYSAVTEVSHLMDYKYSLCEIERIGDKMIADGMLDPDKGAYLHRAIDYVRKDWNEHNPDNQIESFRIEYSDKTLRDYLTHRNPRLTQIGYRTSGELFREIQINGFANKKSYPLGGGHAVSQWGLATINNYKGKVFSSGKTYRNRFSFTHIQDLINNWVIFNVWYMFLKKID